ncbi:hypothetical protein DCO17_01655 [Polynucleobacter tropicus]|uniref:Class I SAM-dependent methyltransferase n=1 Tax=Polynucleobacter tropicus TaxID=1743174 RepID=A0A6M9Q1V2_9BURK|nr:class I SAM-dependent methyltransferase [Polynucleobacter tropicus]QKM64046.1 hypothetical protein DCO17_01655 [Polynucleobacter tropicus]
MFCSICGERNITDAIKSKDFNRGIDNNAFSYYRCLCCHSYFLYPTPHNISFYYHGAYPAYKHTSNKSNQVDLESDKLRLIKKYKKRGKLIEVGPAAGAFMRVASEADFKVTGIEMDESCCKYISQSMGLNVVNSSSPARELRLQEDVDVCVAFHVIEHLECLPEFLEAASSSLSRKGILVLSSPNPESLSFRVFKKYWVHLDAPRHLSLVSIVALDSLMGRYGMVRIGLHQNDRVGCLISAAGWKDSLVNICRGTKPPFRWIARLGPVLSFLMLPFDRISGLGGSYTAIYSFKSSQKDLVGQ